LCLTSDDLLELSGTSSTTISKLSTVISRFPEGIIELVVLHPLQPNSFDWKDIPAAVRELAEMRFYNATILEDAYKVYGVDPSRGALAVVRPDGYIGTLADLGDSERVHEYLKRCLREVKATANGIH
jgi:phenol 2-monooxygenase